MMVRCKGGDMRARNGGRCYHILTLLGAGEVRLILWALRLNEKGNICITIDCIK
jgi:hypothetical protein